MALMLLSASSWAAERAAGGRGGASEESGHADELRRVLDGFAKTPPAPEPRSARAGGAGGTDAALPTAPRTVRRIVVDAGHGGRDRGATGPTGVHEKDVTLAIARRLARVLRGRGYMVLLTRDDDTYVGLAERTRRANAAQGDLFVSVHANAHTSPTKDGIETYSLNVATDAYAARLAARENAAGDEPGSDVAFLLADLAKRSFAGESARLARAVQQAVTERVARSFGPTRDLGVKHALFQVLFGAEMPAVLVETAFVTNPREERRLSSAAYQRAVAEAVAEGVERFVAGQRATGGP
ncbi:MAG: hypothetical protein RL199_2485 [Pseudomonadota bacterium]|jgi:N-acetylmuramoyl-L-alanine amidase